jgi:hypothetical protein
MVDVAVRDHVLCGVALVLVVAHVEVGCDGWGAWQSLCCVFVGLGGCG